MKKQLITSAIQHAILRYCDSKKLSYDALGKELNVSSTTICLWISGKTKYIRPQHWIAIYPMLKPFLGEGAQNIQHSDNTKVYKDCDAVLDAYRLRILKKIQVAPDLTAEQKGRLLELLEF